MIVSEDGHTLDLLGDPHLGRTFIHNVPLHRRGERERMVWQDFFTSLTETTADFHVCMGDLFDKWTIPYDDILTTAENYISAAVNKPKTTFVVLKGNHDWTRDLEKSSAFDVFVELVASTPNIVVVTEATRIGNLLFIPWLPIEDTAKVVEPFQNTGIVAAFGHWDTEFSDHNMVPTNAGIPVLYTGHVHKPDEFVRHGTKVIVVGSMQPYAHGEQADDNLYVTLKADEIADAGDLTNKCVRVIGHLLTPLDCLQLRVVPEEIDDTDFSPTVALGDFDMDSLFKQAFDEAGVPADITGRLLDQFHQKRVANGP